MVKEKLHAYLEEHLSEKRCRHSKSAGEVAENLCRLYRLPEQMGLIAGLGHDIAREENSSRLLELAGSMFPVEKWELKRTKMLHGKAGAVIMRRIFGIDDPEILEAIAWHTTGIPGMGDLAKIVYIADYIEPNRKHADEGIWDYIGKHTLDEVFTSILMKKIKFLKAIGRSAAPPTKVLYRLHVKGNG